MKSETTSLQLEVGKKYKVRNSKLVKYVEITGVYKGKHEYDFIGDVTFTDSGIGLDVSYMSNGAFYASGGEDTWDLVEEYNPTIPANTTYIYKEDTAYGHNEFTIHKLTNNRLDSMQIVCNTEDGAKLVTNSLNNFKER